MNVLGISLVAPSLRGLVGVAAAVSMIAAAGVAAFHGDLVSATDLAAITVGALSGTLAAACGVNIARHGWRGLVVNVCFSIACGGVIFAIANLAA